MGFFAVCGVRGCRVALVALVLVTGCAAPPEVVPEAESSSERWALALHGGAGVIPETMTDERQEAYLEALGRALTVGRDLLERGSTSLDVVEQVIRVLEDEPLFNAGRGAVFSAAGRNELDASIMDGANGRCGAVTGVWTVRHPITLARRVMERTRHVLLAGPGAEAFADEAGVERVEPEFFFVQRRWDQLEEARAKAADEHGTVGVVALDLAGDLAAGTSTGGLTNKRFGRVGDSPIIGAGTWADNRTAAISCTGKGEEFIRRAVAHEVAARMLHGGSDLATAAAGVIRHELQEGDGGLIAVSAGGDIVLEFNTTGMFRGAADSSGRFEVAIWR